MLRTPLDHKPTTKLTVHGRKSAGEGFETVTYQGEDGPPTRQQSRMASLPSSGGFYRSSKITKASLLPPSTRLQRQERFNLGWPRSKPKSGGLERAASVSHVAQTTL
jgi:hypothetical protein